MILAYRADGSVIAFENQEELDHCKQWPDARLDCVKESVMPNGIDSMMLLAITDGEESWYGAEIDKTRFKIVLEDETEDRVYLKIVRIPQRENQ